MHAMYCAQHATQLYALYALSSLSVYRCPNLCLCLSLFLSVSVCPTDCLSVSISASPCLRLRLSASVCLCLSVSVSICLCLFVCSLLPMPCLSVYRLVSRSCLNTPGTLETGRKTNKWKFEVSKTLSLDSLRLSLDCLRLS